MKQLAILVVLSLCVPFANVTAGTFTSNHPEQAYPDNAPPLTTAGEFENPMKHVQERLRANGFDACPANGTFNSKTQAALAQFQLSRTLPASGALDDVTLKALGVETRPAAAPAERR